MRSPNAGPPRIAQYSLTPSGFCPHSARCPAGHGPARGLAPLWRTAMLRGSTACSGKSSPALESQGLLLLAPTIASPGSFLGAPPRGLTGFPALASRGQCGADERGAQPRPESPEAAGPSFLLSLHSSVLGACPTFWNVPQPLCGSRPLPRPLRSFMPRGAPASFRDWSFSPPFPSSASPHPSFIFDLTLATK